MILSSPRRHDVVAMYRIKNEERWIKRSLERTLLVADTVVLFDDGSTDRTEDEVRSLLGNAYETFNSRRGWVKYSSIDTFGPFFIYYIHSPFAYAEVEIERVSEIRDKNYLWSFVKAMCRHSWVLALDGDEMLSLQAVRKFPFMLKMMESQNVDVVTFPFIYLWDKEDQQRVDGLYGNAPGEKIKQLKFPRMFTPRRLTERQRFDQRFAWQGSWGGFHCGSVPMEGFTPDGAPVKGAAQNLPIIHFGYIDEELRQAKFEFYNRIDPGNTFEGEYKHIIGVPDRWCPGPVELAPWEDK